MNNNLRTFDRVIRYITSLFLMTWAIAGGPAWTYVGFLLLLTASIGFCPIYWVLRINSRP
ncbi:MAG: DUF2892 domain-containing protein [Bdellovibrionales bacterium]|nr:DUF2892 domain-containing protein [Bdellovibrionales bacterium]